MRRWGAAVVALTLLLLGAWLALRGEAPAPAGGAGSAPTVPAARTKGPDAPAVSAATKSATSASATAPEESAKPAAPGPAAKRLRVVTGVPGASLTVRFLLLGTDPDPEPATKSADGSGSAEFPLPVLPPALDEVRIQARAEGYAPAGAQAQEFDEVVRIEMQRAESVRGRVMGEDGAGIEGAWLEGGVSSEATGKDGAFEVYGSPPVVRLRVDHPGFVGAQVEVAVPSSGVEIRLARGLEISGRVSFPDGRPVPRAGVQAGRRNAEVDASGEYHVRGLAPGAMEVWCTTTNGRRTVEAGARGVDFVMKQHLVTVRVTDEGGRPFRRADLGWKEHLDGEVVSSGSGGRSEEGLSIAVYPGGRLRVSIRAEGWAPGVGEIAPAGPPAAHELVVVMRRPGASGRILVVARDAGEVPAKRLFLLLKDEGGMGLAGFTRCEVLLDAEGNGAVEGVPPGKHTARLSGRWDPGSEDDFLLAVEAPVTVEEGKAARLEASLRRGGRIRVNVRDADGNLVAWRDVDLLGMDGRRSDVWFSSRTEKEGVWSSSAEKPGLAYAEEPVLPGTYTVEAAWEGKKSVSAPFEVVAGKIAEVEVRFER